MEKLKLLHLILILKKEYKVELEYENTADSDNLGYVKNIKITTNS